MTKLYIINWLCLVVLVITSASCARKTRSTSDQTGMESAGLTDIRTAKPDSETEVKVAPSLQDLNPESTSDTCDSTGLNGDEAGQGDRSRGEELSDSAFSASFRVESSPAVLEVYQDNTLKLKVVSSLIPEDSLVCEWTLAGSSQPLAGCALTYSMPEAGEDLSWQVRIEFAGRQVTLKGLIPLEKLPAQGEKQVEPEARSALVEVTPPSPVGPVEAPEMENVDEPEQATDLSWSLSPDLLEVMQDTLVTMSVDAGDGKELTCTWDPGDGSPKLTGCRVQHLFMGGLKDRIVSLEVSSGGKIVLRESTMLALERLPVSETAGLIAEAPGVPSPCAAGQCSRVVVTSLGRSEARDLELLKKLAASTGPGILVVFLEQGIPPGFDALAQSLTSNVLIPIACSTEADTNTLKALISNEISNITSHSDPGELPSRLSLVLDSAMLVFMADLKSIPDEKWMTSALESGSIFRSRILFTCSGMDRLTGLDRSLTPSPYRVYEKLLRNDTSLLVSGAYPVFYRAAYGIVQVLSPGRVGQGREALLGQDQVQGETASIIDLEEGKVVRVSPLQWTDSWVPMDQKKLPDRVGVFHRWAD